MPIKAELDRGSYLTTYGLLNPWSLWLLKKAPELLGLTPNEHHERQSIDRWGHKIPACPECGVAMVSRPGGFACYRHDRPVRYRLPADVTPPPKWLPGEPPAISLIGQDVDVVWVDDPMTGQKGYMIIPLCTPTR